LFTSFNPNIQLLQLIPVFYKCVFQLVVVLLLILLLLGIRLFYYIYYFLVDGGGRDEEERDMGYGIRRR
jgi:hypothetical protein